MFKHIKQIRLTENYNQWSKKLDQDGMRPQKVHLNEKKRHTLLKLEA